MAQAKSSGVAINRAKPWQLILFTMNDVAFNVYFAGINYLSYFATGVVGFSVVAAANMLTAMRVFDGIIDPPIGVLIDKCNTRFGKFRPFMVGGNLIVAVSLLLMYYTTSGIPSGIGRILYFLLLYALYIIGYSLQSVATRAAQSTLTSDPKQLPMVSVVSGAGCTVVYAAIQMLVSNYLIVKHGDMNEGFFQDLVLYLIVGAAVLTVLAVIGIWEKDQPKYYNVGAAAPGGKPKVRLRDYWDIIKGNRGLQMLILAASTDKLASTVANNSIVGIMVFGIICGNYAVSGQISAYTAIPTFILLILGATYAGRMGQRNAVTVFSALAILFQALILAMFVFGDPTQIGSNAVVTTVFIVLFVLRAGCMGVPSSLVIPMIADCADYELYRTGRFVPGMMGTLFTFVDQTISAFSNTIVGLLIATIGYTSVQPSVDDPLTTPIFVMAMFLWCGLPILGWICSLIGMKFTPLTKEKMAEVEEKIAVLKAAHADEENT